MTTLYIGRGFTAQWVVTLRSDRGIPVAGLYAGDETLELRIADDDGAAALELAGSAVAWHDAAAGQVLLTLDDSDTIDLGPRPRGLSIYLDDDEPIEVFRAVLRVEPRAQPLEP